MNRLFVYIFFLTLFHPALGIENPPDPAEPDWSRPVGLETAIHWAINKDPQLKQLEEVVEAAEGQVDQADRRPIPMIGAEVENFLGSGPLEGVEGLEVTLGISQVIETGDKRAKRTQLARSERDIIGFERELRLSVIEAEVREAFISALLAHQIVAFREEQIEHAERGVAETGRLLEAARVPAVDATRAKLVLKQQQFSRQRAERDLQAAHERLALLIGLPSDVTLDLAGEVSLEPVPELSVLLSTIEKTVGIERIRAEKEGRKAELELEEALSSQDVELFGGARYMNEDDGDVALVMGFEIPWPFSNQNEGNIRSARAQLRSVDYEEQVLERELKQLLVNAHRKMLNAYEESQSLQADLLPLALQSMKETQRGYEAGQFTLLAVLEAQQAVFEIQEAHMEAIARYAEAQSQIQTLTRPVTIH